MNTDMKFIINLKKVLKKKFEKKIWKKIWKKSLKKVWKKVKFIRIKNLINTGINRS